MKTYKYIEAYLQLTIICYAIAYVIYYTQVVDGDFKFINSYLAVGGEQLLSCLVNLILISNKYKLIRQRKTYHILLIVGLGLLFTGYIGWIFLMLLSPFVAVFYCTICFRELKFVNHEKE